MKTKYKIYPDVAGNWGEKTIADISQHPPQISYLDYEFADWFGDDILASFPVFIVSENLAKSLQNSDLTGFEIADCEVSKAGIFEDLHPEGLDLPKFYWLKVGENPENDFWLFEHKRLCVSENALNLLKNFNLSHAEITALA